MQNIYTDENVFEYLYDQLDPDLKEEFEAGLEHKPHLREEIKSMKKTMRLLDQLIEDPSQSSVEIILEYSLSNSFKSSK